MRSCPSVGPSVGWSVTRFFLTPKMSRFLCENHRGSPTLTLLNVLGVLGVLIVLNALNVLDMPVNATLASPSPDRVDRIKISLLRKPMWESSKKRFRRKSIYEACFV